MKTIEAAQRTTRLALGASLTILGTMLGGCVVDTGDEGGGEGDIAGEDAVFGEHESAEVGTSAQAFSSVYAWGHNISGSFNADVMGWATHTAFMMGVTGNLTSPSGASIGNAQSMNKIYMLTAPGQWLGAGVGAVGGTSGRTSAKKYENRADNNDTAPAAYLAPSTDSKLRCYLTGVYSGSVYDTVPHDAYNGQNDWVDIFKNPNTSKWYLGGHGRVGAWAQCRLVTKHLGSWWIAWSANDAEQDLGFDEDGKHCWLTGIGGKLRGNNLEKGVRVYYDAGSDKWKLFVSAGMFGRAECNR